MANLYATISYDHHAGYVSRTGHRRIYTTAETWSAKICVSVDKDGEAHVMLTDKHNNRIEDLWRGNINEEAKR